MSRHALLLGAAQADPATTTGGAVSGGETVAFWILAAVAVIAAVGVVVSRRAVYSAVGLAVVMIVLAIYYGIQHAPFLMVVQIVVYTGAVLMLFLFVLMLVGVSSADSLVETIRGQRPLAALAALALLGALGYGLTLVATGPTEDLAASTEAAGGNVPWIATEVINRYVIAFEATGALLIVAVLGALVLAHSERLHRRTQKQMSKDRIRSDHPTPLPGPGTYARHNAIDTPALLPDGTPSALSINPVLAAREERRAGAAAEPELRSGRDQGPPSPDGPAPAAGPAEPEAGDSGAPSGESDGGSAGRAEDADGGEQRGE